MLKLLSLYRRMQGHATLYLQPGPYQTHDGVEVAEGQPAQGALIGDMIYFLDGPEQREAEAEASFDYVAETDVTASNVYGGENSNAKLLCDDLWTFIEAAQRLDRHKKVLFRKRSNHDAGLPEPGIYRTNLLFYGGDVELLHGIIGVATEAGELAEIAHHRLYKVMSGGPFDVTNVREEIGDVLWYLARLVKWAGTSFIAEMMRNVAKLRKRHGGSFNAERDVNRDLTAERALLERDVVKPVDETFDAEQTEAAAEIALAKAKLETERVHTQFPDEMNSGVDVMSGKYSDEN